MKKRIIVGGIILLVAVAAVLAFTVFKKNSGNGETYRKEALAKGDIEALVVASGALNPVELVEVGSQVSGKIAAIHVDFNSKVTSGQVIALLDQSLFMTKVDQNQASYNSSVAALDKSKVSLENAKKKLERTKSLFEKDLISYEEMEKAETEYFNAVADLKSDEARLEQSLSQLESSRVDLGYTVIKSPIDGVVISRDVNVGQTVAASLQAPVLFQIARDLSQMQVDCDIDEADIGRVKEGQQVRFQVDAFPNETFFGTVTQVRYSPLVQQNVVTYTSIVSVDNPEMKLRPGMTATVSIITGQARDVLRVPNAALRFTPELTQEQMEEIMESFRAQRQGPGEGRPAEGANSQVDGQRGGPRPEGGTSRPGGQGQTMMFSGGGAPSPEMMNRLRQSGRRQMSRAWVEEDGKLKPIMVRTGVTDNSYTEVVSGELKEGQEVIIGLTGQASNSSSRSSGGMRGGNMMFIRR